VHRWVFFGLIHIRAGYNGRYGSLALGGAIGTLSILVKKEFLLPILGEFFCRVTISNNTKVLFQVYKKRFGEGKRIFKMAPFHHHFELAECGTENSHEVLHSSNNSAI
jgi:UDP-N-acetylmuramyl pentapeptide phosphotransferase/UDP-N-acetylglucosamine-1-phosphate transferase